MTGYWEIQELNGHFEFSWENPWNPMAQTIDGCTPGRSCSELSFMNVTPLARWLWRVKQRHPTHSRQPALTSFPNLPEAAARTGNHMELQAENVDFTLANPKINTHFLDTRHFLSLKNHPRLETLQKNPDV